MFKTRSSSNQLKTLGTQYHVRIHTHMRPRTHALTHLHAHNGKSLIVSSLITFYLFITVDEQLQQQLRPRSNETKEAMRREKPNMKLIK
jgi:hypothetical protein